MRDLSKISLFISLFLLIGFPMIFFILFLFTGSWVYLFSGSVPSALAGTFGIFMLFQSSVNRDDEQI